jgi:hypothetical protein
MVCGIEQDIVELFAIVVTIMAVAVALIYMAAQALRKSQMVQTPTGQLIGRPELEILVSIELYQVFVSVIIWVVVLASAQTMCSVSEGIAGGDPFEISVGYLNGLTYSHALPTVQRLWNAQVFWQYVGAIRGKIGPGAWGVIFHVFPFAEFLESSIDFLITLITPFISSLLVQVVGLQLIQAVALRFVLPAGILLRVIPFTRDAGSFLIASALAFYIVFPMTYVMHSMVMKDIVEHNVNAIGGGIDPGMDEEVWSDNQDYVDKYIDGGFGGLGGAGLPIAAGSGVLSSAWHLLFGGSFDFLAYIMLQAVFLPALSMTITVTFVKATVSFIGQKLT